MVDDGPVHFFAEQPEWRRWLEEHHASAGELWVGYHRVDSGRPSITWPQSVDEALCFGWIDGIRKRIDDSSYRIRFTPRRPGSVWSAVNVRRIQELTALGLVHAAGRRAFERRLESRTAIYAYENGPVALAAEYERRFRADDRAWRFFESQPPSYRNTISRWVMSAKQEVTRERRLATLIADSARGLRSGEYRRPAGGR